MAESVIVISKKKHRCDCRKCCRLTLRYLFSHVGLTALVVAYSIMGAFLFLYLEGPPDEVSQNCTTLCQPIKFLEQRLSGSSVDASSWNANVEDQARLDMVKQATIQRLWNLTLDFNVLWKDNWTAQAETQLNALVASVHNLSDKAHGTLTPPPVECATVCYDILNHNLNGSEKSNGSEVYERKKRELDQASGSRVVHHRRDGSYGARTSGEWTFASAFLFAFSVITTIGYGHVTPSTLQGKMVTVLYAIVGIPIMLLFLRNTGICLAAIFRRLFAHLFSCSADDLDPHYRRTSRCSIRIKRHSKQDGAPDSVAPSLVEIEQLEQTEDKVADGTQTEEPPRKRKVHVPVICCLLIMISYLLSGSLLFALWEDWAFLDAFYFCFVTLTTIGFGDLVPGTMLEQDPSSQKLIGCCIYVLLGLALIACCFNLMQEQVRWYAASLAKCVGIIPHERRLSNECYETRQSCSTRNQEQSEEQERIIVATQIDHGT